MFAEPQDSGAAGATPDALAARSRLPLQMPPSQDESTGDLNKSKKRRMRKSVSNADMNSHPPRLSDPGRLCLDSESLRAVREAGTSSSEVSPAGDLMDHNQYSALQALQAGDGWKSVSRRDRPPMLGGMGKAARSSFS